jgi:hypothetical protein
VKLLIHRETNSESLHSASGTPIYSICLVYITYIRCICRPHQYTWNIRGISMFTMDMQRSGYTWYIHEYTTYIDQVYTWYIHVYTWYICDLYTWYIRCISMDIPSFLFPDFSACPCCWSHSMRTHVPVLVIKIGLFHAHYGNCAWGTWKGCPQKAHFFFLPLRGRRWHLALRCAARRLRGSRLGSLVLVTMPRCVVVAGGTRRRCRLRRQLQLRQLQRLRRRRSGLLSWWCRVR